MNSAEIQLRGVSDARLALHATSNQPAWLWSQDGTRILWANPVGVRLFNAEHAAALFAKSFGPADPHRRQIAQLGERLPENGAVRLERLRGFGAALGSLMTCACTRLDFADGGAGLLVVAVEPTGRFMPLLQRLQNLVEGIDTPIAAFARDGQFIGASPAAQVLLGFRDLTGANLDSARRDALTVGRFETPIGFGHMVLQRVGSGADVGLVALIVPRSAQATPTETADAKDATESDALLAPAELIAHEAEVDHAVEQEAGREAAPEPEPTSELEAAIAETVAQSGASSQADAAASPPAESEPSPFVEAVADEPAAEPALSALAPHNTPLRFTWQIDADGRFTLNSDEFLRQIGAPSAAVSGLWHEMAADRGLDPDGRMAAALQTRAPWTGITLLWPVAGGGRLPVEMAGLPLFDRDRHVYGWRGFGICRDFEAMAQLNAPPRSVPPDDPLPPSLSADIAQPGPVGDSLEDEPNAPTPETESDMTTTIEPDLNVDSLQNVVLFQPADLKSPSLTPVENNAFHELARQLSARLEAEVGGDGERSSEAPFEAASTDEAASSGVAREQALLDLLPVPVLVTREDRLLHANPAFLSLMGYPSLDALEQAGGLDAHYAEPGVDGSVVPTDVRMFAIAWDGEPAEGLIFGTAPAAAEQPAEVAAPAMAAEAPVAGQADAEELAAILDTMAEGVVMFDAEGNIHACNRSAEALFGYDGALLTQRNLIDLFAQESQRVLREYIEAIKQDDVASLFEQGREALGQVRAGGLVPMSVMIGRTRSDAGNFFAVLRDLTQAKKTESELLAARRQADHAATAKADVLARISQEVRTPLNAIVGYAEVMIDERFGALGNERYLDYMKDVRASGERVLAIVNDLLDLSRIETGKLDLSFAAQNLNEMVEQCVSVMQPQANRGRIIIRTSLSHLAPVVTADARALRQITLNLIGNSIRLANAGGQVIVSTALSDEGDVVLRVRDTGHGLNDSELAAAMEPFSQQGPTDQAPDSSAVSLSLTKALVEANRARFQIKTAPRSGTLIEVVFADARVKA